MSVESERHNRLAADYVNAVGTQCQRPSEIMVVLESIITASMLLLAKQYKIKPQHATSAVEEAVVMAIERFSKNMA